MDQVSLISAMPELLSTSELLHLLHEKIPNYSGNMHENRSELIELAHRLGLFPKPQRVPRDNRRGAILKMQMATDEPKDKSSDRDVIGDGKRLSVSSVSARLKPPLCESGDTSGFLQSKTIQLRKPGNQAELQNGSIVSTGNASYTSSTNGFDWRKAEKRERKNESEGMQEPERKRMKHTPIRYP